ncbi:hypothetical protein CYMTET_50145 [Cymbomonas tetramitiformis]|uniref:F-box domain-containing protein n=1 Tax=Cymbomonas tetramitiformis TaxID=36881 RepID=A0AAE0EV19_9CHLO|nr:hypothetical protein CYMTET_50145 [Cymbomonas tetramitiformis]
MEAISSDASELDAHSQWSQFPEEMLALVYDHLPQKLAHVLPSAGVCQAWRNAFLANKRRMARLGINVDINFPLKVDEGESRKPAQFRKPSKAIRTAKLPSVLFDLETAGNLQVTLLLGRVYDLRGDNILLASKYWKKAGKAGLPEAQLALGRYFYDGKNPALGQDSEEALLWLQRAAKNVHSSQDVIAAASMILGYLYHDGDGTKTDNTEAIRWFQVAQMNGSKEAAKAIGYMWKTGQF